MTGNRRCGRIGGTNDRLRRCGMHRWPLNELTAREVDVRMSPSRCVRHTRPPGRSITAFQWFIVPLQRLPVGSAGS